MPTRTRRRYKGQLRNGARGGGPGENCTRDFFLTKEAVCCLTYRTERTGAAGESCTRDFTLTGRALCCLSYGGEQWRSRDSADNRASWPLNDSSTKLVAGGGVEPPAPGL